MTQKIYSLYLGGALFDHKALTGNLLLAQAIGRQSSGQIKVLLPQTVECADSDRNACSIRNQDLAMLIKSDLFLACMDGTELDSGTVVEFCFAKALDIPSVLFRSDFRTSGDQLSGGDPWNLMCSNYPRTGSVIVNSMHLWSANSRPATGIQLENYYNAMAQDIILSLHCQIQKPSWIPPDALLNHYRNTIQSAGGKLINDFPDPILQELLNQKRQKGLYS